MKTCRHIIYYGLAGIPAEGGDYCPYCVNEDIERNGNDSAYVCHDATCSNYESERLHYHPSQAELIGTPLQSI
jgi:hypothetical protein